MHPVRPGGRIRLKPCYNLSFLLRDRNLMIAVGPEGSVFELHCLGPGLLQTHEISFLRFQPFEKTFSSGRPDPVYIDLNDPHRG